MHVLLAGVGLRHVPVFSVAPDDASHNIENFVGVAQVPLGIAGPLRVNGEHAKGDFLIPLATTEGSLVASYSRGMKVLTLAGGATTTRRARPKFFMTRAAAPRLSALWGRCRIRRIFPGCMCARHV